MGERGIMRGNVEEAELFDERKLMGCLYCVLALDRGFGYWCFQFIHRLSLLCTFYSMAFRTLSAQLQLLLEEPFLNRAEILPASY